MNKRKSLLILIISMCFFITGCATTKTEPISKSGLAFDTFITITIYDSQNKELLDNCFKLCTKYENLFSRTIDNSEISKINSGTAGTIVVSDETAEIIQKGLEYGTISDGNFDITIGSVSELWDFKSDSPALPNDTLVQNALTAVNYNNVELSGNTVTLKNPKTKIDLGGIAKGFIADKLKEYLTSQGVEHAMINLGGNILAIGNKLDGSDFTIGIQKPFDEKNASIAAIKVSDKSVVSSGIYERYFKIDDKIYHHILNPKTGYPYENDLYEVTIISDKSVDGDGLSTTCFALGLDKGLALIESLEDTEAIFITNDYKLHYTSGIGTTIPLVIE